jgi:hypothetical protein
MGKLYTRGSFIVKINHLAYSPEKVKPEHDATSERHTTKPLRPTGNKNTML